MAKRRDGVALDRRRHDGGSQRLPSIESLQAPARSQSCACSSSIQVRQTPHSIIHGDACFAYFNKIWGIPSPLLRTRPDNPAAKRKDQTPHHRPTSLAAPTASRVTSSTNEPEPPLICPARCLKNFDDGHWHYSQRLSHSHRRTVLVESGAHESSRWTRKVLSRQRNQRARCFCLGRKRLQLFWRFAH
jgi:hypothetical protein